MRTNDDLDRNFREFDARHPEIWRLYQFFAWQWKNAGHSHGSSEQIIQRLRWETDINPERDGGYKIANEHRKRYAQKLEAAEPVAFGNGFFRFRNRRSK